MAPKWPITRHERLTVRRKPESLKHLQGTARPDRTRRAPVLPPSEITRPKWLTNKVAKAEFARLLPLMEIADIDSSLLASCCMLYARWRQAEDEISERGLTIEVSSTTRTGMTVKPIANPAIRVAIAFQRAYLATATKLGLTPVDRGRIEPADSGAEDMLDQFLAEGDDDDE
jgi:P27 family predicted phage terminase small subunit